MITCSREAGDRRNEESLVVSTTSPAPSATKRRNRSGKTFSKQIGAATDAPSTWKTLRACPGTRSAFPLRYRSVQRNTAGHGTYSPNGTRWTLVYRPITSPPPE